MRSVQDEAEWTPLPCPTWTPQPRKREDVRPPARSPHIRFLKFLVGVVGVQAVPRVDPVGLPPCRLHP